MTHRKTFQRALAIPAPVWAMNMIQPIRAIASQVLTTGTVLVDDHGTAIVYVKGTPWCAASAIEGVITLFEQWQARTGKAAPLDALRRFTQQLRAGLARVSSPCSQPPRNCWPPSMRRTTTTAVPENTHEYQQNKAHRRPGVSRRQSAAAEVRRCGVCAVAAAF
jgi:hypothetical protein